MIKCKHEKKGALFLSSAGGWKKTNYKMCKKCFAIFKKEEKQI